MTAIPIVVCGLNLDIAKAVREAALPEYDVIHINLSVPEAKSSIPAILSSTAPPSTSSPNSGSQNYTQRPAAVALGGGFSDAMFEEIKASCGEEKILWLRMDNTRKTDMPDLSEREAFGRATAARLKTCLHGLGAGKEGAKTEGSSAQSGSAKGFNDEEAGYVANTNSLK
ncbi:hypothetical protein DDE83_002293 [Stemphylium lycopersici]|uniref:Uncharacterized protein n=1 Tax=Stemphylium lycopersici TaxID=183478 RepID=A0A364NAY8_STELY|nr:hypothetical protein DDE83_002293 [Stemphylium lycopersici]